MSDETQWPAPIRYGRWIMNTIFHQAIAVIMIYAIWLPIEQYSSPFSWHVILCTLGFVPLMAEALILFGGANVWSQNLERSTKRYVHGGLMTVASILIIAGVAVEIGRDNKDAHFESSHAITGLVSFILLLLSLIIGVLAQFSKQLSGYVRPVILKFAHNVIGAIAYIIGIVSFCLGFYTGWFEAYTTAKSRDTATVATAIFCFWSLIYAFVSGYKQIRSIVNK